MLFSEKSIRVILGLLGIGAFYMAFEAIVFAPRTGDPMGRGLADGFSLLIALGGSLIFALATLITLGAFYKRWSDPTKLYFWLIMASPLWLMFLNVLFSALS